MVELLKESGFSDKAIDYYTRKVNVGIIKDPSISFSYTGYCGDTMIIYLKIDSDIIVDAKFKAIGCAGAFSAGSALMHMIKGKSVIAAKNMNEEDISEHLQGMPGSKTHCASLAITTLEKTLKLYTKKKKI